MAKLPMLLGTLLCMTAHAADLAREQRIRLQIEEAIQVGLPITLRTDSVDFLAILTEAEAPQTRGAALLLHGRGANPDWGDVIRPLRTGLPAHGWDTLSLQLPVAAADAPASSYESLIPEAFPRIAVAVDFLTRRNIRNIVLIGYSLGARMGLEWLAQDTPPETVRALVAIGLAADPAAPERGTLGALARIGVPVLDLYASDDLDRVRHTARERAAAARKAENRDYRPLRIEGAGHSFHDQRHELLTRVRAWLARMAPGREVAR